MFIKYHVGDIVKMRKTHPCGGEDWKIMRTGVDFRIQCLTCGRVIMLPRRKFEKSVKKIVQQNNGLNDSPGHVLAENKK